MTAPVERGPVLPDPKSPAAAKQRWSKRVSMALIVFLVLSISACSRREWSTATRVSAGIAPNPLEYTDAVVMAFRAKVWGVRGWLADHTWMATKDKDATTYTVYEVIGWRKRRNLPVVRIAEDIPDRHWFGSQPHLMVEVRGEKARTLIAKVDAAARSYPYSNQYRVYPGPNSNTFTAWIAKQVPELGLELPFRAIGRNYKGER